MKLTFFSLTIIIGIAMMAFTKLRSALSFDELRRVYAVMAEKELRIHVDVEELLEDWDEKYGRLKRLQSDDRGRA